MIILFQKDLKEFFRLSDAKEKDMNENINEKVIKGHKNGMAALILITLLYVGAIVVLVGSSIASADEASGSMSGILTIVSLIYLIHL